MRMLPRPSCPRAGQSGLWQNWSCGSIGDPHGARFDDHARRDAWWTRAFQAPTILITVPWGATAQPDVPRKHALFDLMEETPMIVIPIRKLDDRSASLRSLCGSLNGEVTCVGNILRTISS